MSLALVFSEGRPSLARFSSLARGKVHSRRNTRFPVMAAPVMAAPVMAADFPRDSATRIAERPGTPSCAPDARSTSIALLDNARRRFDRSAASERVAIRDLPRTRPRPRRSSEVTETPRGDAPGHSARVDTAGATRVTSLARSPRKVPGKNAGKKKATGRRNVRDRARRETTRRYAGAARACATLSNSTARLR